MYISSSKVSRLDFHSKSLYIFQSFNPLDSKGNYSATSNNTKLVHWPLMGRLLHLVQRGGAWTGCSVPNVTAHPSAASVPLSALLYDGPLLCGFNVAIKRLTGLNEGIEGIEVL